LSSKRLWSVEKRKVQTKRKKMEKHRFRFITLLSIALILAIVAPLRAAADDDDDPPSRVARLAFTQGSVSFQPAGTDDWVSPVVNRPMTTGDKLWTDKDSRAELNIGSASLRIGDSTGFSFLNLNDNVTQIQLTEGELRVRVKHLDENETFEIDTPSLAFSVLRSGVYRVNVNENGDATVIRVGSGEGEVTGGGSAYSLHAEEMGTFTGTDQLQADIGDYGRDDDFDRWCADRDRHEDLSVSSRYVSPDVIGYQDLDDYGWWRQTPDYGMVWFPHTTVVGWAPYHYGHWAYIAPWGYTWIDDAPWGFAPFHYGRWVFVNGAWGWIPAPPPPPHVVYVRPVYAPALVAWVGGPHFGVGLNVGWFPLGPREVFVPSYRVSRTYVTNINITNTRVSTTVINNYYTNRNVAEVRYVNREVAGGVTVINHETFVSAGSVSRNVVRIDQREIVRGSVTVATPAIAPERRAVLGTVRVGVRPPAVVISRTVVARTTPPPPRVSFAKEQEFIRSNGGRPPAISEMRNAERVDVRNNVRIAPAAVPRIPQQHVGQNDRSQPTGNHPGNFGGNRENQPGNVGRNDRPQPNGNQQSTFEGNRGNQPGNGGRNERPQPNGNQQGNFEGNRDNQPGNIANNNPGVTDHPAGGDNMGRNGRGFNDRPPSSRPGSNASAAANSQPGGNSQMDQRHQQQLEQLHNRQDQERQQTERRQSDERQKMAQNNPDPAKTQRLNQKQEQQLQHQEQKHDSQQRKLQDKQDKERRKDK